MDNQPRYTTKLKGAKVLVIGASSGIGYAIAEALLEHDAVVAVSSSDQNRIDSAAEALKKISSKVTSHVCQLGDASTAEDNIKALFEKTGELDHVVVTAGDALAMVPVQEYSIESIMKAGQVRFVAPLLIAKSAVHYVKKSHTSSITFTGGVLADRPIPGWTLVSAFAAGMEGAARGLAIDLKPIRVNVVRPGMVDTNLYNASGIPDEMKNGIFADASQKLPVGRIGRPENLAEAYLYIMKDENVTGEMLNSNGGQLLV